MLFLVEMYFSYCHVLFFSQLRAQNQVLKKAVVDEQANSVSLKVEYSQKSTQQ